MVGRPVEEPKQTIASSPSSIHISGIRFGDVNIFMAFVHVSRRWKISDMQQTSRVSGPTFYGVAQSNIHYGSYAGMEMATVELSVVRKVTFAGCSV